MESELAEKPKATGTLRQKRVARRIVRAVLSNEVITAGEILRQEGYSLGMSHKPSEVIDTPGVRSELNALGFNEDKAKQVVGEILGDSEEKAEARLKAADMVFKTFGTYAPDRSINVNVYKPDQKSIELAQEFEQRLLEGL